MSIPERFNYDYNCTKYFGLGHVMQQKQVFQRIMKILFSVFIVSFVYLIVADRRAPFTTEGAFMVKLCK